TRRKCRSQRPRRSLRACRESPAASTNAHATTVSDSFFVLCFVVILILILIDPASSRQPIQNTLKQRGQACIDIPGFTLLTGFVPVQFEDIQAAVKRIAGFVIESPCPLSLPLSDATGMKIYCKLEYLQRTGSFKERGARNALELLSPEQKQRGVIAASPGNHALGLACHARLLGITATVVMPRFAPLTKVVN